MKKILLIAALPFAMAACKQDGSGAFTVSGEILNATEKKVFLQELPFDAQQPIILDSGTIAANGKFSLKGLSREEGLYRLVIENGPDVLLVNDTKEIKLTLDVNHFRDYKVTGSPASEGLHTLFETYRSKDSALYATFMALDSLQQNKAGDSVINIMEAKRDVQMKQMNDMVTDFISNSKSATATYYAIGMASRTMDQAQLTKLVSDALVKYKDHKGLTIIKNMLTAQNQRKEPTYELQGKPAPEIAMPDTKGNLVKLSSFRGKYVLVDFWASWCAPCRQENPNVVAAYEKFKDKNFTILGVSLDNDKAAWEKAIADDKLSWTQISDLKYWESAAVAPYGIQGIPFNVLVDPQGNIIANNLRGEDLEKKLGELVK